MKKNKLSKEEKNLEKKLKELGKVSKSRPTQINSSDSYQFHIPIGETSKKVEKKQECIKWVLINREGQLVGRLDYNPENTRASARKWFYNTKKMINQHGNFDELFKVLTTDEFDELQKMKPYKDKVIPSKVKNDEISSQIDSKRIRFASPSASIYKSSSIITVNTKSDSEKKKKKFLEFLGRAPISFGDEDELD